MTRGRTEPPSRDWEAIRAAVARSTAARTPEQARAIMDARARKLAARPERSVADRLALAVFELASERYAVELRWIREVARLTEYTPVPGTPDHVVGLTSVRGAIIAVIDLRRLFGLTTSGLSDRSRLALIGDREPEFGLLVDRALGTTMLPASDVLAAPAGLVGAGRACVRGVTGDALIVLDGRSLLMDPRLVIDQTEGIRDE